MTGEHHWSLELTAHLFIDSSRGPPEHVNVAYEDSNFVIPEGLGGGKQLKVLFYRMIGKQRWNHT